MGMTYIFFQKGKISMQFQWKGNSQTLDNTMTLSLIRMTKDEKGLAFFVSFYIVKIIEKSFVYEQEIGFTRK